MLFKNGTISEAPEEHAENIRKAWAGGETEIKCFTVENKFYGIKLSCIDMIYEADDDEFDDVKVEDGIEDSDPEEVEEDELNEEDGS
jgi:hypothetical protein